MRRLPRLFECVGYSYEPAIQTAALRVILPLTQRESHLVPLLVQAGHHLPRIIKGFARWESEQGHYLALPAVGLRVMALRRISPASASAAQSPMESQPSLAQPISVEGWAVSSHPVPVKGWTSVLDCIP